MTLPNRLNLYRRAIALYGAAHQLAKFYEEIGELMACIGHFKAGRTFRPQLASEIADVTIMLEQLALLCGIPWGAVERERARKLERLRERVDHAESVARPVAPCDGAG